jgi:hypothetical protein
MTGRLVLLGDLIERTEPATVPEEAPTPPRDEREDMRAFIERDHEETDLIRLRLGRPALYTNEGAYCRWTPKAGAR